MRRLVRVYGATFNKPKQPVAWATVDLTVAHARFTDARRTFFDHLVDKLRWDE